MFDIIPFFVILSLVLILMSVIGILTVQIDENEIDNLGANFFSILGEKY